MAKHLGSYRITPEWWKAQVRDYLRADRGRQERMAAEIKCSWTGIPLGDEVADSLVGELNSEAERVLDINEEAVRGAIAVLRAEQQGRGGRRHTPPWTQAAPRVASSCTSCAPSWRCWSSTATESCCCAPSGRRSTC